MNNSLELRTANLSDLEQILQWTLALNSHEDDGQLQFHSRFKDNLKKWITAEFSNPNSLFIIAEDSQNSQNSQEKIGFIGASLVINDNGFLEAPIKGVIQLLWIEPDSRKKNIAQQLVLAIENCLLESGATYIECSYTCVNAEAQSFWNSIGYLAVSTTARKQLN